MTFAERKDRFEGYGDGVLYVPFSCGGCPGRRVSRLLLHLTRAVKKRGIERSEIAVHIASCTVNDSAHYPPCPHLHYLKTIVRRAGFPLIEGSYISKAAEAHRAGGNRSG
jgi:predicted metal-binding protein